MDKQPTIKKKARAKKALVFNQTNDIYMELHKELKEDINKIFDKLDEEFKIVNKEIIDLKINCANQVLCKKDFIKDFTEVKKDVEDLKKEKTYRDNIFKFLSNTWFLISSGGVVIIGFLIKYWTELEKMFKS